MEIKDVYAGTPNQPIPNGSLTAPKGTAINKNRKEVNTMRKLTLTEKETIILFNEGEKQAECYTCNIALMNKLDKLCENFPEFIGVAENEFSKTYTFPKKYITIHKPRFISEEKRKKMALRLKEYNAKMKNQKNNENQV